MRREFLQFTLKKIPQNSVIVYIINEVLRFMVFFLLNELPLFYKKETRLLGV